MLQSATNTKAKFKIADIISDTNNTFNIWLSTQRVLLQDRNIRSPND